MKADWDRWIKEFRHFMDTSHYILVGKEPVPVDLLVWAEWYETADRQIAEDIKDEVRVSTVFLGLDHNFGCFGGPPVLFETMIFGGEHDGFQERYATYDEAVAGHREACELAEISDILEAVTIW